MLIRNRCQVDYLEKLASNKHRREALEKLPPTLPKTYERILERAIEISESSTIQFVERTLRWITLAQRPLSVREMAHAVSVEIVERSFDDFLEMDRILALCSSLVREVNGILAFSHFSVKESLMDIKSNQEQLSRFRISNLEKRIMAQTCLSYLLLGDLVDWLIREGANVNGNSATLGSPLRCAISGFPYYYGSDDLTQVTPEARYQTVCRLLREGIIVDQSQYDAVADALSQKDEKVAHVLLEYGFNLTSSAIKALDCVSAPAFLNNVNLGNLNVDLELSIDKYLVNRDVLQLSLSDNREHRQVVPIHLERDYMEIIKEACSHGYFHKVKDSLLRLPSLDWDRHSNFLSECLVGTAEYGHADLVQFLLESGASQSYQRRSDGRTALHTASKGRHADVVQSLLETGLQDKDRNVFEIQDIQGLTPWMCAIQTGSTQVLDLFLTGSCAVDLRISADDGQTAAHFAAQSRNDQMINYLHERHVDFTRHDMRGRTPIHVLLEQYKNSYDFEDGLEALQRAFRCLKYHDMLCEQTESGKNILHLLAELSVPYAECLWTEIRDDATFDKTAGCALAAVDKDHYTPLHLILRRIIQVLSIGLGYPVHDLIPLLQIFLAGHDDERSDHCVKDRRGCTPLIFFAKGLSSVKIPSAFKGLFSECVLEIFRMLAAKKRSGQFQEMDDDNRTILHHLAACRTNFPFQEVTELALENQTDVGMMDVNGEFPLTRAAYWLQDNVEFMRLLIPRMQPSQLEQSIYSGDTILHYICKTKRVGAQELIADFLLPYVAQCEKRDRWGCIPLSYTPQIISDEGIATRLFEMAGDNVNTCDDSGRNCMYWSCQVGSKAMVSALLDAGADIDATLGPGSKQGAAKSPPLLIAANYGQLEVVDFLLEKKADPKVKEENGWQLHHFAFFRDSQQFRNIVAGLRVFDYRAKVSLYFGFDCEGNRVLTEDATPFHIAIMSDDANGLQWLLEEGKVEDISEGVGDGSSPLLLATIKGNLEMCRKLVGAGTSISKSREDGLTAFHAACKYGHVEICKLIIANDENSILNKYGERTPLELAADEGKMDIVHFLLEQGCDTTVTAEILARNSGHHEIGDLV